MALLWFLLVVAAACAVLLLIRRCFGVKRTMRRVAFSLAVCERALEDALGELVAEGRRDDDGELFVSPFEPVVVRMLSVSEAEALALGADAAALRHRLLFAISTWNAAAGCVKKRAALLPAVLDAHRAARGLARCLEERSLSSAREHASERILVALVGRAGPVDLPQ